MGRGGEDFVLISASTYDRTLKVREGTKGRKSFITLSQVNRMYIRQCGFFLELSINNVFVISGEEIFRREVGK